MESMIILNKYHINIGLALAIKMIVYFPKLTGVQIQKYYFKIMFLEPIGFGAIWCAGSVGGGSSGCVEKWITRALRSISLPECC